MSITELADYRPKHLGPEPWGNRFARAREDSGHTIRTAAMALGQFSHATVTRLEALDEEPTKLRDRQRAFMLLVLYGYDPEEFGLGPEDVPPVIDLKKVRDLGNPEFCCTNPVVHLPWAS